MLFRCTAFHVHIFGSPSEFHSLLSKPFCLHFLGLGFRCKCFSTHSCSLSCASRLGSEFSASAAIKVLLQRLRSHTKFLVSLFNKSLVGTFGIRVTGVLAVGKDILIVSCSSEVMRFGLSL